MRGETMTTMTDAEKIIFLEDAMKNHEKRIRELEKKAQEGEKKFKELVQQWNQQQKALRKLR